MEENKNCGRQSTAEHCRCNPVGRKGYKIYPKALNIVWGNDKRFWKLPKYEKDGVELIQVNWLGDNWLY
ncbi:hypothetical protein H5410_007142 [Solanum commersonii]|uniref:Uncharacterized protein n=1 Tax=Solanum commersonii TaxID=4109 RepID=A0A9J6AC83_SOLCO|nr:hypothetical protein H5410_007142 [Solanum commersonii]